MKFLYAIFFTMSLLSCRAQQILSYEEGLKNCERIAEEKSKDDPDGFFLVGADCVQGFQIPEFESSTIEGLKINRAKLKGKVSIINFWFLSCPPCIAEMPGFNAIVERFGKDQINYLAIGLDDRDEIQSFLEKNPWHFDHIADGNNIIMNVFKIRWGFPTTFVLDKEAKIVLAFSGGKADSTAVQAIQDRLVPAIERELK